MSLPFTDEFVTVNGVKLHYQDWGNPDAPPLLMVHGITMSSRTFDPVAAMLKENYHCMTLDLRGHGDSEWADPETYKVPQYAMDVVGLLDALGIEKTHYIGISLGGITAMAIASVAPHRFSGLALNDIGPKVVSNGAGRIQSTFSYGETPFPSVEQYAQEVLFSYSERLKALPLEMVVAFQKLNMREVEGGFLPKFDPKVLDMLSGNNANTDEAQQVCWKGFRGLTCPILVIRGEISDILSSETLAEMQAAQPGMTSVVVPGAGHTPGLTEPIPKAALESFFG